MTAGVLDFPMTRRCVPFGELDRRFILGASEVAPVLGMSRFWTPLAIYLAKRRTDAQLIDKHAPGTSGPALWGNRLERIILDSYAADMLTGVVHVGLGVALRHGATDVGTVLHGEHPWRAASPDGIVTDANNGWLWGVEAKNVDRSQGHRWGDTGTDQVPDEYALQCHWGMHVTGLDRWDVAALIGGNDFRIYTLRRDEVLLASVVAAMDRFWYDHVLAAVPPEAAAADNALLSRLLKQGADELIEGNAEIDGLASQLADAQRHADAATEVVDRLEAQLKLRINDRAGAQGPWGKILWRQNRPTSKVDWEGVAREANATTELILRYTDERPGARPFRVTLTGEG